MSPGNSSEKTDSCTEFNEPGATKDAATPVDTTKVFKNENSQLMIMFLALESTGNGLIVTDPKLSDNPIVHANQAFADRCGFQLEQILGQNCRFLQQGDRQQESIVEVRNAINEQRPIETVFRNYRKDGTLYFTELSIAPVHDARGKLTNYVGVQYDVSARQRAKQRIAECYSVLSHELRTPVTSIAAAIDLLNEDSVKRIAPKAKNLLRRAEDSCNKLTQLIDAVLAWDQSNASHLRLRRTSCRISELIAAVTKELSPLATYSKVDFKGEAPEGLNLMVDSSHLKKILTSLATIAIRSSHADGKVVVSVQRVSQLVFRFSVTTDRRGNTPPASQVEDARPKDYGSLEKGIDLDLAICRTLLDYHDSNLNISQLGLYETCYWFELTDKVI